jgi:hypothetical protein
VFVSDNNGHAEQIGESLCPTASSSCVLYRQFYGLTLTVAFITHYELFPCAKKMFGSHVSYETRNHHLQSQLKNHTFRLVKSVYLVIQLTSFYKPTATNYRKTLFCGFVSDQINKKIKNDRKNCSFSVKVRLKVR